MFGGTILQNECRGFLHPKWLEAEDSSGRTAPRRWHG
jgi:hypothetical protein